MADNTHALRQRYIDKVRAIEYSTRVSEGLIPEDSSDNPYYLEPYIKNDDGSGNSQSYTVGGPSSGSQGITIENPGYTQLYIDNVSGAVNTVDSYTSTIRIGEGNFYWVMDLPPAAIAEYEKRAIPTVGSIKISTRNYFYNGKIELPQEADRKIHAASTMKYIQSIGGINKDTKIFNMITKEDFDFGASLAMYNGLWARADFITYLKELQRRVLPQLISRKSKLTINSLYRPPSYEYAELQPMVYWNGHLAGLAADISAIGEDRAIIADEAYKMGFGLIAIGQTFVHVDILGKCTYGYNNEDGSSIPVYESPNKPGRNAYR